jgi:hypothetical protein
MIPLGSPKYVKGDCKVCGGWVMWPCYQLKNGDVGNSHCTWCGAGYNNKRDKQLITPGSDKPVPPKREWVTETKQIIKLFNVAKDRCHE